MRTQYAPKGLPSRRASSRCVWLTAPSASFAWTPGQDHAGYCIRRIGALSELLPRAADVVSATEEWRVQRDTPPLDARLGRTISSSIVKPHGGKGGGKGGGPPTSLEDVAARWDATGSGAIDRAAFSKQVVAYKNLGALRIDGLSADVTAQVNALFDGLCAAAGVDAGGAEGAGAGAAEGADGGAALPIMATLERLMEAATAQEEALEEAARTMDLATAAARRMQVRWLRWTDGTRWESPDQPQLSPTSCAVHGALCGLWPG